MTAPITGIFRSTWTEISNAHVDGPGLTACQVWTILTMTMKGNVLFSLLYLQKPIHLAKYIQYTLLSSQVLYSVYFLCYHHNWIMCVFIFSIITCFSPIYVTYFYNWLPSPEDFNFKCESLSHNYFTHKLKSEPDRSDQIQFRLLCIIRKQTMITLLTMLQSVKEASTLSYSVKVVLLWFITETT